MVQVFAQTGQTNEGQKGLWDEEDMNGYQLLNEVGSGGTLSSLFTILSLFTEDVKMSWQDGEPSAESEGYDGNVDDLQTPIRSRARTDSDVSHLNIDSHSPTKSHIRRSSTSSASTIHAAKALSFLPVEELVHESSSSSPRMPPVTRGDSSLPTRIHHGIVARATEDTTLAVIPAEAFRRLTKNFPKATGHIVQGWSRSS
jgi:lysophospholipid hydrolase